MCFNNNQFSISVWEITDFQFESEKLTLDKLLYNLLE